MAAYDVFISFRNTDDNGCPTPDVAMAESLYHALWAKGYNPFFSKYSIDSNGRADYVTLINNALETAKVLVAVASSRANITSRWVKREINMFSALMMREPEGARILLTYRADSFPVDELPVNLADLQSFPDEKAVVRFIDVALRDADGFRNDGSSTEVLYGPDAPYVAPAHNTGEALKVGDVLDNRYTILSQIGRGGYSNVFLANNTRSNHQVAVKEIRKSDRMDFSVIMESFQHEIDMMRNMRHPSLPELIDVLPFNDSLVVVMEYVSGQSLQTRLSEQGAQPEAMVLGIARQLAEVLDYMHNLSSPVIYRDMKPANIILRPDGKVKIIDFGTARYYKPGKTADTTCLGTVGYAAPEQYSGMGQTDARTDIYGLGVTLYHLATGKSPAEPPYQILPIRQINPELSEGLEIIIQKCTQKDPAYRYQSAKDLIHALDNIHKLKKRRSLFSRKPKVKPAPPPKPIRRSPLPPQPIGSQFQPTYQNIPGAPVVPPKGVAPVVLMNASSPVNFSPVIYPSSAIPQTDRPGFTPQTGSASNGTPTQTVTVDLTTTLPLTTPLTAPVTAPITTPLPFAAEQTAPEPDPELKDLITKLTALDPEAQELVKQLIERLSK